jgi:hypothetical protein
MQKIMPIKYLLALVMLVALPVSAEWKQVAEGADEAMLFVDFGTFRKDGSIVRFWQLTNFSKPKRAFGKDVFSLRARVEFDCKQEREKLISISLFSEFFAKGEVITSDDTGTNWSDIPPDTVASTVFQSVCKAPAR